MALTQKLNIYDTNLAQVMRVLVGAGKPVTQAQRDALKPFEAVPLKYEIRLSQEAYDVLQQNPLLKQKIQLDMIQIGQKIVRSRIVPMMGKGQQVTPQFRQRVETALKQGETDVNALVDSVLRRHAEMNKAWGDYYKSMRKDLIFTAIGIGLSIASVALAVPTGGASLALTIAGGARSIAAAVNKVGEAWRTAEEQHKRLRKSIMVLLEAYQRSVHQGRAMQISGALLDTIGILPVIEMLPFVRQQLMPNMNKIKAEMTLYKGKLGSLYETANRLAAQLFELLDQIDEWKKQNPGKVMPGLKKIEDKIDDLLDSGVRMLRFRHKLTISGAYKRYEDGMGELGKLDALIVQLNGIERHPRAVAIISAAIKAFGNLAFAGGSYGVGPTFEGAGEIASFVTTISNDVQGTVNDMIEFSEHAKGDAPPGQVQQLAQQVSASYAKIPVMAPTQVPKSSGPTVPRPNIRVAPTQQVPKAPPQAPRVQPMRTSPLRPVRLTP